MKIEGTPYFISKSRDGQIWYDFGRGWKVAQDSQISACELLLSQVRKRVKEISDKDLFYQLRDQILSQEPEDSNENYQVDPAKIIDKLIYFFSEFHFEPNFRFINTFALATKTSIEKGKEYVSNYFDLIDSPYASSIREKMKSAEFKEILSDLCSQINPQNVINKRFKLYYGSQGTGKTTKAMEESDNCMVCHSAMLPSDLMEDFKFVDGHPEFQPSVLQRAIVEGKVIVLDEINLLPFESLRFLQSILDGKKEFSYKGKTIQIADGFKIIGTMNLVVNGCTYSLPEPLVDRAEELRKFSLTAQDLVGALI